MSTLDRTVARRWGQSIRSQRNLLQMPQAALAAAVGVEQGTVSKWERGLLTPPVQLIPEIAAVLHCDPSVLFSWPAPARRRELAS